MIGLPMSAPVTHYTKSGGVNIAYQVVGTGPLDLVFVPGWISHLELGLGADPRRRPPAAASGVLLPADPL